MFCLSIRNRMAPPTQHPLYPILEVEYDDHHRAHILSDNDAEVALPTLMPRTHTRAHQWDEHYAPYIRCPASSSLSVLSTTVFRPLT